ncbi:hypothetical protein [Lignipirellula cremea]|uniref:Uncharacterized protein n=1 Tax=Lignipirellula cremea TaxID=2528010 RepID=A0A518DTG1_9BACT|nr:hypothetical protein [Lignipirellula cremea]QDU95131.1 hypothetical protein Pla8534_29430 [Lignipirellula cremea]
MADPIDFAKLCTDFTQMRFALARSVNGVEDVHMRGYLDDLCSHLDTHFADFQRVYPETMAVLDAEKSDILSTAAKYQTELKQGQAELAKAKAARAEKKEEETPDIDPKLAASLREEILDRFPQMSAANSDLPPLGEIWQDWRIDALRNRS